MILHIDTHSDKSHRMMGTNGVGRSFHCFGCGELVKHRLPVCRGIDYSRWFCSVRCAKNTVALFDGQVVNYRNGQWNWKTPMGDWIPVLKESVMELAVWSDDNCLNIMEKESD